MTYGLPTGTAVDYGANGFPQWVYQLAAAFGLQASTYAGHQETDRNEVGFAPNPHRLNRGIDWTGAVPDMQRFADYLLTVADSLEQVIWQNPATGQRVGVAGGRDVTETPYYAGDYPDHTDHVHTRQSEPISVPDTEPKDTLFADVSEFQPVVDDTYPYKVLSIRVCDGDYRDKHFAANYAWMRKALDSGKLTFGIVYTYVRPQTWQTNADTVVDMIDVNGGLHPRVCLMLDVESGGNPPGDQSMPINALHGSLADYADGRIIGYGNVSDLKTMWRTKPPGICIIVAAYGSNPGYPGKVAHQYTDGHTGCGAPGLPCGVLPFGNCDMNSADGLTATEFAAACGIVPASNLPKSLTDRELLEQIWQQLRGPDGHGWPQLGGKTPVDAIAELLKP